MKKIIISICAISLSTTLSFAETVAPSETETGKTNGATNGTNGHTPSAGGFLGPIGEPDYPGPLSLPPKNDGNAGKLIPGPGSQLFLVGEPWYRPSEPKPAEKDDGNGHDRKKPVGIIPGPGYPHFVSNKFFHTDGPLYVPSTFTAPTQDTNQPKIPLPGPGAKNPQLLLEGLPTTHVSPPPFVNPVNSPAGPTGVRPHESPLVGPYTGGGTDSQWKAVRFVSAPRDRVLPGTQTREDRWMDTVLIVAVSAIATPGMLAAGGTAVALDGVALALQRTASAFAPRLVPSLASLGVAFGLVAGTKDGNTEELEKAEATLNANGLRGVKVIEVQTDRDGRPISAIYEINGERVIERRNETGEMIVISKNAKLSCSSKGCAVRKHL